MGTVPAQHLHGFYGSKFQRQLMLYPLSYLVSLVIFFKDILVRTLPVSSKLDNRHVF